MSPDGITSLLDQLILRTKEGKLLWNKTSKSKSYKTSFKSGNAIIESVDSKAQFNPLTGEDFLTLSIYDDKGEKAFQHSTGGIAAVFARNTDPSFEIFSNRVNVLFNLIQDLSGSSLKNMLDELSNL